MYISSFVDQSVFLHNTFQTFFVHFLMIFLNTILYFFYSFIYQLMFSLFYALGFVPYLSYICLHPQMNPLPPAHPPSVYVVHLLNEAEEVWIWGRVGHVAYFYILTSEFQITMTALFCLSFSKSSLHTFILLSHSFSLWPFLQSLPSSFTNFFPSS